MLSRIILCLLIGFLVLINLSCTKLTEEEPVIKGEVNVEELPYKDAIPANWGKLISVSSSPEVAQWVQLWFENEEGQIRMVAYNIIKNRLSTQARVFHRK